jgi:NADPH2:quinone reductase
MVHAIRIHETGGPDVLRWESLELPPPGAGEARVRHTAIGLNFIDTYHRSGLYSLPLPTVLGTEAAGVVEELGPGVTDLAVGDRVAYATGPLGAYAEARNIVASVLVKVPAGVDDKVAAAAMLKGLTAHYLLAMAQPFSPAGGTPTFLVHAAAGGTGSLLCQWAKHRGATVIGTVGTEAKASVARANGCDHVILYRTENVPARIAELTKGQKVDVVFDSVGKDTFHDSLACVRPRGLMASFGNSSGAAPAFEPRLLAANGSLFLTRPVLKDYTLKTEELRSRANDLFAAILAGVVKVRTAQTYRLRGAATAHQDLESRKTTGSTLLVP